jgi:hypothetical protein
MNNNIEPSWARGLAYCELDLSACYLIDVVIHRHNATDIQNQPSNLYSFSRNLVYPSTKSRRKAIFPGSRCCCGRQIRTKEEKKKRCSTGPNRIASKHIACILGQQSSALYLYMGPVLMAQAPSSPFHRVPLHLSLVDMFAEPHGTLAREPPSICPNLHLISISKMLSGRMVYKWSP